MGISLNLNLILTDTGWFRVLLRASDDVPRYLYIRLFSLFSLPLHWKSCKKSCLFALLLLQEMLVKWPCFEDDGVVEELIIVDSASDAALSGQYKDNLLITRSYHEIKVWLLHATGTITYLATLNFDKEIRHLQPYLKRTNHLVSCSSEYGVITWDLVNFAVTASTDRKPCKTCQFTSDYCRHKRVLLLFHSMSHMLEYHVYGNYFNLVCLKPSGGRAGGGTTDFCWNYPSHEKWPWAHRKPGLACLITNLHEGFTETTKITMFVATQDKKIYCMVFDAADLEENGDYQLSEVLSGSRTWNSLIDDWNCVSFIEFNLFNFCFLLYIKVCLSVCTKKKWRLADPRCVDKPEKKRKFSNIFQLTFLTWMFIQWSFNTAALGNITDPRELLSIIMYGRVKYTNIITCLTLGVTYAAMHGSF